MEEYVFFAEKEFIPFDQIAEPTYVFNLTAHIITIIICLFLLRIIWSWIGPLRSIKKLLMSQVVQREAFARLLVEKGIFSKEEFWGVMKNIDKEMGGERKEN